MHGVNAYSRTETIQEFLDRVKAETGTSYHYLLSSGYTEAFIDNYIASTTNPPRARRIIPVSYDPSKGR